MLEIVWRKGELSYTVGGNILINCCSNYGEQCGGSSKKLKMELELPYVSAVPLLGIYLGKKNIIQQDTCIPTFTVVLFAIHQYMETSQYPSTDEWVKKIWYIGTMEH